MIRPATVIPGPLTDEQLTILVQALKVCRSFAGALQATVYRCAKSRWAASSDLFNGEGSKLHGQRWNPVGVAAAYTSLDYITANYEMVAVQIANGLPVSELTPYLVTSADVDLAVVLDLTGDPVRSKLEPLGFTLEWMVQEPWRKRLESKGAERGLTIELGRAAHDMGIQGLIVPSAAYPGHQNLVIFPDLCPRWSLKIVNEDDLPKKA